MEKISLRMATNKDKSLVVALDYDLDKDQHIEQKMGRKDNKSKKITINNEISSCSV